MKTIQKLTTLSIATLALGFSIPSMAATFNYVGTGTYNDLANWGGSKPLATDDAWVGLTGSGDLTVDSTETINTIIQWGFNISEINVVDGGTLNVNGNILLNQNGAANSKANFNMHGGTLNAPGVHIVGNVGTDNIGRYNIFGGDFNAGVMSVGTGTSSLGEFNINGGDATVDATGLTVGGNGTLDFQVDDAAITSIDVSGNVILDATSQLIVNLQGWGETGFIGETITLANYGGSLSGTFGTVKVLGGYGSLDYGTGSGSEITFYIELVSAPEPSSLALLAIGGCLLLSRRNRKLS